MSTFHKIVFIIFKGDIFSYFSHAPLSFSLSFIGWSLWVTAWNNRTSLAAGTEHYTVYKTVYTFNPNPKQKWWLPLNSEDIIQLFTLCHVMAAFRRQAEFDLRFFIFVKGIWNWFARNNLIIYIIDSRVQNRKWNWFARISFNFKLFLCYDFNLTNSILHGHFQPQINYLYYLINLFLDTLKCCFYCSLCRSRCYLVNSRL